MKITATQLRAELYRILDQVAKTGEEVEVKRAAGTIVIRAASSSRVARRKHKPSSNPNLVVGDPDDLVRFDWARHWKPFL